MKTISKKFLIDNFYSKFIRRKIVAVDNILIDKALSLNPNEKFILIELLVKSINQPDEKVDKIWLEEAQKRLNAHRKGISKGIPVEEVFGETL